jgi:hypothetical protein
MADAGRDVSEQIAEDGDPLSADSRSSAVHRGSFGHSRDSFHTVNKDFGVYNEDVPLAEGDPLLPGRRRRLLAACMCILGNELCERLAYYGLQTNMGECN